MDIKLLSEELEHRGLTKEELARKCGITNNAINEIFSGNRRCTVENAKKIANALNLNCTKAIEVFFKA